MPSPVGNQNTNSPRVSKEEKKSAVLEEMEKVQLKIDAWKQEQKAQQVFAEQRKSEEPLPLWTPTGALLNMNPSEEEKLKNHDALDAAAKLFGLI